MSASARTDPEGARMRPEKVAMAVFVVCDAAGFAALFAAALVVRAGAAPSPGQPAGSVALAVALTAVLAAASGLLVVAERRISAGRAGGRRAIAAAAILGLAFVAVQLAEYRELASAGLRLGGSHAASSFYALTGYHGVHVAAGVALLAAVLAGGRDPGRLRRRAAAASIYWHFVGAIWIAVALAVYRT